MLIKFASICSRCGLAPIKYSVRDWFQSVAQALKSWRALAENHPARNPASTLNAFDSAWDWGTEILEFSIEAKNILFEWQKINTDQCNNLETEDFGSIYSKLDIYILRIALILEILSYACGESNKVDISPKSVEGAISIIDYFKRTAEKVYSIAKSIDKKNKTIDTYIEANNKRSYDHYKESDKPEIIII